MYHTSSVQEVWEWTFTYCWRWCLFETFDEVQEEEEEEGEEHYVEKVKDIEPVMIIRSNHHDQMMKRTR